MITQREYDLMQLDSEIRMEKLLREWRRAFLGRRGPHQLSAQPPEPLEGMQKAPEPLPEEIE